MSYLIIGAVVLLVLSIVSFIYAKDTNENPFIQDGLNDFAGVIGVCSAIICFILCIVIAASGYCWVASGHKMKIINKEYDKNYTQEQIFYAESVVDEIRQLDRKRIEINGNIFNNKK